MRIVDHLCVNCNSFLSEQMVSDQIDLESVGDELGYDLNLLCGYFGNHDFSIRFFDQHSKAQNEYFFFFA